MNLMFGIILSLSIISFIYYMIIIIYNGPQTAFSEFWLFACLTGAFLVIIMRFFILHGIKPHLVYDIIVGVIMIVGFGMFLSIEGLLIYHSKQKADQGMDYIIILGAQVKGTTLTKSLRKRLNTALTYLQDNPATVAIVSGGKGDTEELTEAEAMKRYLLQKGIAQSRVIKEDKSRNTFENILYSKSYIKPDSSIAIVSNGFHMYRSMKIARKQGLKVQGIAAATDAVLAIHYYTREFVGVLKDKLIGNI